MEEVETIGVKYKGKWLWRKLVAIKAARLSHGGIQFLVEFETGRDLWWRAEWCIKADRKMVDDYLKKNSAIHLQVIRQVFVCCSCVYVTKLKSAPPVRPNNPSSFIISLLLFW